MVSLLLVCLFSSYCCKSLSQQYLEEKSIRNLNLLQVLGSTSVLRKLFSAQLYNSFPIANLCNRNKQNNSIYDKSKWEQRPLVRCCQPILKFDKSFINIYAFFYCEQNHYFFVYSLPIPLCVLANMSQNQFYYRVFCAHMHTTLIINLIDVIIFIDGTDGTRLSMQLNLVPFS